MLAALSILAISSVVQSPAVPMLDDCTVAHIAYSQALYNYHECYSSLGGMLNPSSCDGFLAIVNSTRAAFEASCHVTVSL